MGIQDVSWGHTCMTDQTTRDILHGHTSRDVRVATKMVELQKTLSFDEDILPHILRERQKHSGRLAEEGYGSYTSFSQQPPKQT